MLSAKRHGGAIRKIFRIIKEFNFDVESVFVSKLHFHIPGTIGTLLKIKNFS